MMTWIPPFSSAGCNSGNTACTYDSPHSGSRSYASCSSSTANGCVVAVENWWLSNLATYGAMGVALEDGTGAQFCTTIVNGDQCSVSEANETAAQFDNSVDYLVAQANSASVNQRGNTQANWMLFQQDFGFNACQSSSCDANSWLLGTSPNQFTSSTTSGSGSLRTDSSLYSGPGQYPSYTVPNSYVSGEAGSAVYSPPNELTVSTGTDGTAYYTYDYSGPLLTQHEMTFAARIDSTFTDSQPLAIARTQTSASSNCTDNHGTVVNPGQAQIVLQPEGGGQYQVQLDYWNGACVEQTITDPTSYSSSSGWVVIQMSEVTGSGSGDGSFHLTVNGDVYSATGLSLNTNYISDFALGAIQQGSGGSVAGLHFGDLQTGGWSI